MKIKTHTARGVQLDYAIAMLEQVEIQPPGRGHLSVYRAAGTALGGEPYSPTLDGNLFIILLNREKISLVCSHDGVWLASDRQNYEVHPMHMVSGLSAQEAFLRCMLMKHVGIEINVPKELR